MRLAFPDTAQAIRDRRQTVTRRLGSKYLSIKPGTLIEAVAAEWLLICPIRVPLLAKLEVISVKPEPLRAIIDDLAYGLREHELECISSGISPTERVTLFWGRKPTVTLDSIIARIEFRYL